jgi:ParB-like chromosome segregation protein Spo0J
MILEINKMNLSQINSTLLMNNLSLDCSVTPLKVDYCKRVIQESGFMPMPIAGKTPDNRIMLLHGQCEVKALKDMGERNIPVMIVEVDDSIVGDKITLQLMRLNKNNNSSFTEALTLEKLIQTGKYTLAQIGGMIGQSESWVSKRNGMIKRLDKEVLEMLAKGELGIRSAIEISKIPTASQLSFAINVVNQKLTKRSIEKLIPALASKETSPNLKSIIVANPIEALKLISQEEKTKNSDKKGGEKSKKNLRAQALDWFEMRFLTLLLEEVQNKIAQNIHDLTDKDKNALNQIDASILKLSKLIQSVIKQNLAPGQVP